MAPSVQHYGHHLTRWQRVMQGLTDLAFITSAFQWFLLLLSRLAEPFMFLATLYVIAETVLPTIFTGLLFQNVSNASVIVLNLAPEIIMPGCFLRARSVEKLDRWKFNALGFLFLGLTFLTLISFVYKASDGVLLFILLVRCATGVLYALVSMMSTPVEYEHQQGEQHQLVELRELLTTQRQDLERFQARIEEHLYEQLQAIQDEILQNYSTSVSMDTNNVREVSLDLLRTREPRTETLPLQGGVSEAVKPVQDVSEADRNAIIAAHEHGIARRKICAHLGWGTGKYRIVKSVLDAYEQQ